MTAEDGLNIIHFGFVHRVALKNKIFFNHLKNGIFAFSSRRKSPAFEVRFLALKSILLIIGHLLHNVSIVIFLPHELGKEHMNRVFLRLFSFTHWVNERVWLNHYKCLLMGLLGFLTRRI